MTPKQRVRADQGEAFGPRLGDRHPVEGIVMVPGQTAGPNPVRKGVGKRFDPRRAEDLRDPRDWKIKPPAGF